MKNQSEIYKKYANVYDLLSDHVVCYQDLRDAHIRNLSFDNGKVMDFGCGTGNVTIPLLEQGREVTSIDTSQEMLDILRSKLKGIKDPILLSKNLSDLSEDELGNGFSAINMMNVLYHLENPEEYLNRFSDILVDKGIVLVSGPAKGIDVDDLYKRVKADLAPGVFENYSKEFSSIYEHNKKLVDSAVLYDRESLEKIANESGFLLEQYDDSFYYENNYLARLIKV